MQVLVIVIKELTMLISHLLPSFSLMLAVLTVLPACSATDPAPGGQSSPVPPRPVEQMLGRFRLGPNGGQIFLGPQQTSEPQLHGLLLAVPAGALASEVEFTVTQLDKLPAAAADELQVGPALRITPEVPGLTAAATLWLPYRRADVDYTYSFFIAQNEQRKDSPNPLARTVIAARPAIAFPTLTFGTFAPVIKRPPTLPDGLSGRCNLTNVDVLFVIDNSPSMADKQQLLISKFPKFAERLVMGIRKAQKNHIDPMNIPEIDLHLGIVTSDVGFYTTETATSGPFAYCTHGTKAGDGTWNGDDGLLQGLNCTERMFRSDPKKNLKDLCNSQCKTPLSTTDGSPFIDVKFKKDGTLASNLALPMGMTTEDAINNAFACRAFLGDQGCGIEQPLESIRRSLIHDAALAPDKRFFRFNQSSAMDKVRKSSVLLAVILTDEDDQSVSDRKTLEYVSSLAPLMPKTWKSFNPDLRGFAMSTTCNEPFDLMTPTKSGCHQDDPGKFLLEINMHNDRAGSVLDDLLDPRMGAQQQSVLIAGIWSMFPLPFTVPAPGQPWKDTYGDPPKSQIPVVLQPNADLGKAPSLSAALCDPMNPSSMTRAPQHRLSNLATARGAQATLQADICEPAEYEQALDLLVTGLIGEKMTMCP